MPERGPETATPPGGLKVLPSGLVVYEFEGTITALGLALPEEAGKGANATIKWVDSNGVEREFMFGSTGGKQRTLNEGVIGLLTETTLELLARNVTEGEGALSSRVRIVVAGIVRTIFNELEQSNFLQVIGALSKRSVNFGNAELEYPGGSPEATPKAITHSLGQLVKFATVIFTDAGNVPGVSAFGETTFNAKCQKRDGTSPAAGTKAPFFWLAIG